MEGSECRICFAIGSVPCVRLYEEALDHYLAPLRSLPVLEQRLERFLFCLREFEVGCGAGHPHLFKTYELLPISTSSGGTIFVIPKGSFGWCRVAGEIYRRRMLAVQLPATDHRVRSHAAREGTAIADRSDKADPPRRC